MKIVTAFVAILAIFSLSELAVNAEEVSADGYKQDQKARPFFREDFSDLIHWEALTFPKISRHTDYEIVELDEKSVLRTHSKASASGMTFKNSFNVYEHPHIRFRWRIENIYQRGDARRRSGDDYPARVYILFEYDPDQVGFGTRLRYRAVRALYGEYPPHSTLNYIWESRATSDRILTSSYTDRAKLFVLRSGVAGLGSWHIEERNILKDYREAFGEDPPAIATLAIMNDSDDTGEEAVSYFDFIEIY